MAKQNSASAGACCYYDNSGLLSCFDGAHPTDCQAKNGILHPGYICAQSPCFKKPKLQQSL
jgi:hypothetical protein